MKQFISKSLDVTSPKTWFSWLIILFIVFVAFSCTKDDSVTPTSDPNGIASNRSLPFEFDFDSKGELDRDRMSNQVWELAEQVIDAQPLDRVSIHVSVLRFEKIDFANITADMITADSTSNSVTTNFYRIIQDDTNINIAHFYYGKDPDVHTSPIPNGEYLGQFDMSDINNDTLIITRPHPIGNSYLFPGDSYYPPREYIFGDDLFKFVRRE